MNTITTSEFRKKLRSVLEKVEDSEVFALTRRGRRIARIEPGTITSSGIPRVRLKGTQAIARRKKTRKSS